MTGPKKNLSKHDLEIENARLQERLSGVEQHCWANAISAIMTSAIPAAALLYVIAKAADVLPGIIHDLAGKQTVITISVALSWVLTVSAGLLWLKERKQKQREIVRLTAEIKECRSLVDPGRATSGLTTKGTTNKSDLP